MIIILETHVILKELNCAIWFPFVKFLFNSGNNSVTLFIYNCFSRREFRNVKSSAYNIVETERFIISVGSLFAICRQIHPLQDNLDRRRITNIGEIAFFFSSPRHSRRDIAARPRVTLYRIGD